MSVFRKGRIIRLSVLILFVFCSFIMFFICMFVVFMFFSLSVFILICLFLFWSGESLKMGRVSVFMI